MNSDAFEKHWVIFEATARPLLEAARDRVQKSGITCEVVEVVDRDVDQGLGFIARMRSEPQAADNDVYIELMLMDGDEVGLEMKCGEPVVAVGLDISNIQGVSFASLIPKNYTEELGTASAVEIIRRVTELAEPFDLSIKVIDAWGRSFSEQAAADAAFDEKKRAEAARAGGRPAAAADLSP